MTFLLSHWEGLASLLLSLVSIGIAICSARSTSKDATRQIASVKELGDIQAEASLLSIDVELQKVVATLQKVQKEYTETRDIRISQEFEEKNRIESGINGVAVPKYSVITKSREKDLENEIKYLSDMQNRLSGIKERMLKYREEGKA